MKRFFSSFNFGSFSLLIASCLTCLLLCEGFMRVRIFGDSAWSYSQMKSLRHIGKSGLLQASPSLDILWELRPNVNTIYKLWPFTTNSKGLRDKEYPLVKPPHTFRVAVIGDSFTMGEGISIENAYHSLLEHRFNSLNDGRHYEFINFGVAGYSLVQYLGTIEKKVLDYNPDVILIGFCAANDSKLPNMEAFKKPYEVKSKMNGFFHFYSLELLGNIYKTHYNKFRGRHSGYNADAGYVDEEFKKLAALVAGRKLPIIVAYIDNKAASSDRNMIEDAARKFGFDFIDGTTNFGPVMSDDHIIYLTDGHPNAAANKIFADTLFPALQASPTFNKLAP